MIADRLNHVLHSFIFTKHTKYTNLLQRNFKQIKLLCPQIWLGAYIISVLSVVNFDLCCNFWTIRDALLNVIKVNDLVTFTLTFSLKIEFLDFVAAGVIVLHFYSKWIYKGSFNWRLHLFITSSILITCIDNAFQLYWKEKETHILNFKTEDLYWEHYFS